MKVIAVGLIKTDLRFPKGSKKEGKRIHLIELVESGFFSSTKISILTEGEYRKKIGDSCKSNEEHFPAFLSKKKAKNYMGMYHKELIGRHPSKL